MKNPNFKYGFRKANKGINFKKINAKHAVECEKSVTQVNRNSEIDFRSVSSQKFSIAVKWNGDKKILGSEPGKIENALIHAENFNIK